MNSENLQVPKSETLKSCSSPLVLNPNLLYPKRASSGNLPAQKFKEPDFGKFPKEFHRIDFGKKTLQRRVLSANYSKSYETFATKKIQKDEKMKTKCEKCVSPKPESLGGSSFFHDNKTDYCKTIFKNKNFFINALPFEKRTGINLNFITKKGRAQEKIHTSYQKINREWVQEFFWKKCNTMTPLKEQKLIRENLVKEACHTEDIDESQLYRLFNSHFMKNILVLGDFKKEFTMLNQMMEENFPSEPNNSEQNNLLANKKTQFLGFCLKHLTNSGEVLIDKPKKSELFKRLLYFQHFLTETLLKKDNSELAIISDLIFKMFSFLYENEAIDK